MIFVIVNVLVSIFLARLEREHAINLLIDTNAPKADELPRYDLSAGGRIEHFWKYIPQANRQPLIILNGMSQMYAINDRKSEDKTISEHLDDALAPNGVRVFGLAAPNLTAEESLIYLAATAASPQTKPALFVYGVCFDKMRNIGVRTELRQLLEIPGVTKSLSSACRNHGGRYPLACNAIGKTIETLAAPQKAVEPTLEDQLKAEVERVLPVVAGRKTLNASIQSLVFRLRNWALNITPTSKRVIIASRYEQNQQLMELAAQVASERGVQLAWYNVPLNPQAENPYVPIQYASFKSWVDSLARKRNIPFANLEHIVPASKWGEFMGGPDFKHFRGAGHFLTAQALLRVFDFDSLSRVSFNSEMR